MAPYTRAQHTRPSTHTRCACSCHPRHPNCCSSAAEPTCLPYPRPPAGKHHARPALYLLPIQPLNSQALPLWAGPRTPEGGRLRFYPTRTRQAYAHRNSSPAAAQSLATLSWSNEGQKEPAFRPAAFQAVTAASSPFTSFSLERKGAGAVWVMRVKWGEAGLAWLGLAWLGIRPRPPRPSPPPASPNSSPPPIITIHKHNARDNAPKTEENGEKMAEMAR